MKNKGGRKLRPAYILAAMIFVCCRATAGGTEAGYSVPPGGLYVGARAVAMGGAFVGIAEGSSALFWNPAGLGRLPGTELGLHHDNALDNSMEETAVFSAGMQEIGGFAASVAYSNDGNFESRDDSGELTGLDGAGSFCAQLGWGKELIQGFSAGFALKAGWKYLAGRRYGIAACDAGILWDIAPELRFGLSFSNLGTAGYISCSRAGFSYNAYMLGWNTIKAALSAEALSCGTVRINGGVEDNIANILKLRIGYIYNVKDMELKGLTGLTAGIGFSIQDVRLDYSYAPFGELGISNRISFIYEIQ